MSEPNRFVVIMAGGRGERFWPASRLARPKHLLPIVGDKPMLAQTLDRLEGLVPPERVLIITNAEQREACLEVCPQLPPENIVAEPVGRDTAAAVGLATVLVGQRDANATFAMLPADAVIHDHAAFRAVAAAAFSAAEAEDALVTVGIPPTFPATGYGYIQRGASVGAQAGHPVFEVVEFKEKPDAATAESYLASGDYSWNAGMFFWRVPVIAACFAEFTPGLWQALGAIREGLDAGEDLAGLLETHYPALEKISVDYAIMENARTVRTVPATFDWDDVGEWPAIARHFPADGNGNVVKGTAELAKASGNIVVAEPGHVVALVGVDDLIVVQTPDATLICPRDRAQDIKAAVRSLGAQPHGEALM